MDLFDTEGFAPCLYDFVYLPIKIKLNKAFGYAFINFVNEVAAERFVKHFTKFSRWGVPHSKCADVDWAKDNQGLEAQVERYRDHPLMAVDSPDEFRPIVLKAGKRVQFPEPTHALAEPRSNEQRSLTWSHLSHGTGDGGITPASSPRSDLAPELHEIDGVQSQITAHKKAKRSAKRIKSKLYQFGYYRNV